MKKIFIGIKLENTNPFQTLIEKLVVMFKWEKMKWVNTENLHLTLFYFGKTSDEHIAQIQKLMSEKLANKESFDITYSGTGVFKNVHNPRVLWVGLEKNTTLLQLKSTVDEIAQALNKPLDHTEYLPHITVAQLKWADQHTTVERYLKEFATTVFGTEKVQKISLFEVTEVDDNKTYKELYSLGLS